MTERLFPRYPEGLSDEWVERCGHAMVSRAHQVTDADTSSGWHQLGCWLLDVVDYRRAQFDEIAGIESGGLAAGFHQALEDALQEWPAGIDGDVT